MRKFLLGAVLLTIVPGLVKAQAAAPAGLSAVILGYYLETGTTTVPTTSLNLRLFTHICHGSLTADSMGNVKMPPAMAASDLVTRAHAVGVKVLVSVGGEDSGSFLNAIGNEPESTKKFVSDLVAIVLKYHYDGVDIDWEFPANDGDRDGMVSVVSLLRETLQRKVRGSIISVAVPSSGGGMGFGITHPGGPAGSMSVESLVAPGGGPEKYFDAAKLATLVDFLNVRAYGFHGDYISTGYNSNLVHDPGDKTPESYSVTESMDYWVRIRECPKTKLVVGIPAYGQQFHSNHITVKQNLRGSVQIPFKDLLKMDMQGWQQGWDQAAYASVLASKDGKEYITFDSVQAAQIKGQWVRQQGFRGVFLSNISQDSINNDNVLAHAARNGYAGVK